MNECSHQNFIITLSQLALFLIMLLVICVILLKPRAYITLTFCTNWEKKEGREKIQEKY
jgi:hypothetical protein